MTEIGRRRKTLDREWIAAPVLLGLGAWLLFGPQLGGDRSIATFQDNTYLLLPLFHALSETFTSGEFPYWIPALVGGLPIFNTPQFSVLYPFYFLDWGLYTGPVEALRQVHVLVVAHLILSGINTYVALRLLSVSPWGSGLAAGAVAASANAHDYASWINITAAYSWLPLVISGAFVASEGRRPLVGAGVLSAALSFLILASPSQPMIHAFLCLSIIGISGAARLAWRGDKPALRKMAVAWALAGVTTLLVVAPALIPTVLSVTDSIRFIGDFPPVVGWERLPFQGALLGQLRPSELAAVVWPFRLSQGSPVGEPFVGGGVVMLALIALVGLRRRWVLAPLAFLALYTLASATGSHLGLAQLNHRIPFLGQIREPSRHLVVFILTTAMLAGFGFDIIRARAIEGVRAWATPGLLSVTAAGLIVVCLAAVMPMPLAPGESFAWFFGAFAGLAAGVVLLGSRLGPLRLAAAFAVVILVVATARPAGQYVPRLDEGDYFRDDNLASHRVLERLRSLPDASTVRFVFQSETLNTQFWSMNASYHGLRSFQAYMNPLPYTQFTQLFQRFNLRHYYPMLGAKYVVCRPCTHAMLADYRLSERIEGFEIRVAESAMSRYTLVNRVAATYKNDAEFYNLIHAGFDYASATVVHAGVANQVMAWVGRPTGPFSGTAVEEFSTTNRRRVRVTSNARAVLVLNEVFVPHWRVRVNGMAARPVPVNLNQIGVLVGSGDSLVEFEYHPTVFVTLRWLQRLTLVGLAGAAIVLGWRRLRVAQTFS